MTIQWYRGAEGKVVEVINHDPAGLYAPELAFEAVPAELAAWVQPGWPVIDGALRPDPEDLRSQMLKRLAERRWAVETAGLTLTNGTRVVTSRESQALINAGADHLARNPDAPARFKGANGWLSLSAAEFSAIRDAVAAHVAAAFSREADIAVALDAAGSVPELLAVWTAEIDLGWPGQGVEP